VVTGATRGIGRAIAEKLARRGDHVVLACRDLSRGSIVCEEIARDTGNNSMDVMLVNLESVSSVRNFSKSLKTRFDRLDVLINNAGIFRSSLEFTEEGVEKVFAVNYLSTFYLTNLVSDLMEETPGSTVINLGSNLHRIGTVNFRDLFLTKGYDGIRAYAQSKLCVLSFTMEMARRHKDILCNCYHPGAVHTDIGNAQATGFYKHGWNFIKRFFLSADQGAETALYLSDSRNLNGLSGRYFYRKKAVPPASKATCTDTSERLWAETEKILSNIIGK
jgi:NAD(P)-dependent dehydrogenase (short-subunit alcohol dehydrogenase family)